MKAYRLTVTSDVAVAMVDIRLDAAVWIAFIGR